ncbi:hypothetical protein NL64_06130 [Pseudomonas fluorescens]|uniref:hypothetical protein n=1 Tax=Pseudomonas fluorescens TaxID=294 RepID=UPI00054B6AA5|nr:hypothetical protein [Pseudomonas fluorescens]KII34840.1 hypothetical protein NL64_06130 [Pseudomonas fluorescens]
MRFLALFLLKFFSDRLTQQVVLIGLEQAAARTTNTVDDQVVAIVRQALGNRVNPIQRVVGK